MARFDPNTYPDRLAFEAYARRIRSEEIDKAFHAAGTWLQALVPRACEPFRQARGATLRSIATARGALNPQRAASGSLAAILRRTENGPRGPFSFGRRRVQGSGRCRIGSEGSPMVSSPRTFVR